MEEVKKAANNKSLVGAPASEWKEVRVLVTLRVLGCGTVCPVVCPSSIVCQCLIDLIYS